MLRNIFFKTLRDQIKPIFFWGVGISFFVVILVLFFPSVKQSSAELNKYLETLPPALKPIIGQGTNYATPEGYFTSQFFSLTFPIVFLIFSVTFASGAILGEESKGTMNLLLANPIPRFRIIVDKFAAFLVSLSLVLFLIWSAFALGALLINTDISLINILQALISVGLLSTLFASLTFALSGFFASRGAVVGLTGLAVGISFFLNVLAPLVDQLKSFQKFSAFYLYNHNNPIVNGLLIQDVLIFVFVTLVFLVIAVVGFSNRDIGN